MTALMKFMAAVGFASALSLAATSSFAQNVSGSICGDAQHGVHYC